MVLQAVHLTVVSNENAAFHIVNAASAAICSVEMRLAVSYHAGQSQQNAACVVLTDTGEASDTVEFCVSYEHTVCRPHPKSDELLSHGTT